MILRPQFGLQDPVASLTHLLAAAAVAAASCFLHRKGRGDRLRSGSLAIFSASLFLLFASSGVYHGLPPGPWRALFRRLDYAAIWIFIAGSATPVHTLLLRGHWRWSMTALFWIFALASLVTLEVYFTRLGHGTIIGCYIGLASLGFVSYSTITRRYGWKEGTLLILGGGAYAAGAAIELMARPVVLPGVVGPHELFHVMVVAGAAMHWLYIYNRADGREERVAAAWAKR